MKCSCSSCSSCCTHRKCTNRYSDSENFWTHCTLARLLITFITFLLLSVTYLICSLPRVFFLWTQLLFFSTCLNPSYIFLTVWFTFLPLFHKAPSSPNRDLPTSIGIFTKCIIYHNRKWTYNNPLSLQHVYSDPVLTWLDLPLRKSVTQLKTFLSYFFNIKKHSHCLFIYLNCSVFHPPDTTLDTQCPFLS